MRSLILLSIFLTWLSGCKSVQRKYDDAAIKDVDIKEFGELPKVIYRDGDVVYLVTCPKEAGKISDHIGDEELLGRGRCNSDSAATDENGKKLVQSIPYREEYLPRLLKSFGLTADQFSVGSQAQNIEDSILSHEAALARLATLGFTSDINKEQLDKQVKAVNEKLAQLRQALQQDENSVDKIKILEILNGYLDVSSNQGFNISEKNAGILLAPFLSFQQDSAKKIIEAGHKKVKDFLPCIKGSLTYAALKTKIDSDATIRPYRDEYISELKVKYDAVEIGLNSLDFFTSENEVAFDKTPTKAKEGLLSDYTRNKPECVDDIQERLRILRIELAETDIFCHNLDPFETEEIDYSKPCVATSDIKLTSYPFAFLIDRSTIKKSNVGIRAVECGTRDKGKFLNELQRQYASFKKLLEQARPCAR